MQKIDNLLLTHLLVVSVLWQLNLSGLLVVWTMIELRNTNLMTLLNQLIRRLRSKISTLRMNTLRKGKLLVLDGKVINILG